jgi:hypothetical protein
MNRVEGLLFWAWVILSGMWLAAVLVVMGEPHARAPFAAVCCRACVLDRCHCSRAARSPFGVGTGRRVAEPWTRPLRRDSVGREGRSGFPASVPRRTGRLIAAGIPLEGASDLGVSEALYLRDRDAVRMTFECDTPGPFIQRKPTAKVDLAVQTCWIADNCQPCAGSRWSRRKVHTSVTSCGTVRSPETTRPVALSTRASMREKRMATVA